MSEPEELTLSEQGGVLVAVVTGEIDLANGPALEAAVLARAAGTDRGVVVDLTGVTFLDSSGVRFLDHVAAADAARAMLVVAPDEGRVRYTLRLCGFPADLVREDLDAAVTELQVPPSR